VVWGSKQLDSTSQEREEPRQVAGFSLVVEVGGIEPLSTQHTENGKRPITQPTNPNARQQECSVPPQK
jgi:hypothetical protein